MGDGVFLLNKIFEIQGYTNTEKFVHDWLSPFSSPYLSEIVKSGAIALDGFLSTETSKNKTNHQFHRNKFISWYVDDLGLNGEVIQEYLNDFVKNKSQYYSDYNDVSQSEVNAYVNCDQYFSFWIGYDQCPEPTEISFRLKNITRLLLRKNQADRPNALKYAVDFVLPSQGIEIPFEAKVTRKSNLTVKELLELAVNVNDPQFQSDGVFVNNQPIDFYFLDKSGKKKKSKYLMTTSQRMETTVREVRFDLNYLGVSYMNSVVRADNYFDAVSDNYKLLKRCALYLRYCLRFFNKQEFLMVKNGIATYPALWDLDKYWGHGDLMQGLITTLVASSSAKAAKADVINWKGIRIPYVPSDSELKNITVKSLLNQVC